MKHDGPPDSSAELLLQIGERLASSMQDIGRKLDAGIKTRTQYDAFLRHIGRTLAIDTANALGDEELTNRALQRWLTVIHNHGGPHGPEAAEAIETAFIDALSEKKKPSAG